jgi:hypothetical protein
MSATADGKIVEVMNALSAGARTLRATTLVASA